MNREWKETTDKLQLDKYCMVRPAEPRLQLSDRALPWHSFFSLLEAKVKFAKRVWGEKVGR